MSILRYVYVAGPITKGDIIDHVRAAIFAGDEIIRQGGIPYLPQLTVHWGFVSPRSYEDWMDHDFLWIDRLDCLIRLPGESAGADREVRYALEHGKPVFYSIEEWVAARRGTNPGSDVA